MNKKHYLIVLCAVALTAFLSITIYKAYFEKGSEKEERVDASDDEEDEDEDDVDSGWNDGSEADDDDALVDCDICHCAGNVPGMCGICQGTGNFNGMPCPTCHEAPGRCFKCKGTGRIRKSEVGHTMLPIPPTDLPVSGGRDEAGTTVCPICKGTKKCTYCAGNGFIFGYDNEPIPCSDCHQGGLCSTCHGNGYVLI